MTWKVVCLLVIAALFSMSFFDLHSEAEENAWHWKKIDSGDGPSARRSHATAIDPESHTLVLFGGYGNGSHLGDTWLFHMDNSSWTLLDPGVSPSARAATNLVYSPLVKRMYLFGGFAQGHSVVFNDTWSFDPSTNSWQSIHTSNAPSARASYGMAYDTKRDRMLLFGGFTEQGYHNDLWSFDPLTNEWKVVLSESNIRNANLTVPQPRGAMGFDYDQKGGVFILYGGFSEEGILSDTWIFDPATNLWREIAGPGIPPPARTRMVYDEGAAISVFFGGDTTNPESVEAAVIPYGGAWQYNYTSNRWNQLTIAGNEMPSARSLNSLSYDPLTSSLVLFGGTDTLIDNANFEGREFNDLWYLSSLEKAAIQNVDRPSLLLPLVAAAIVGIIGIATFLHLKRRSST